MQITCPSCSKTTATKADVAGKSVKCSCGHRFRVPQAPETPASVSDKMSVQCSCGRKLKVPAAAAGKKVKCPCGKPIAVPPVKQGPASASSQDPPPFQGLSDEDWGSLTALAAPPQPVEEEDDEPKPMSATEEMLERARVEMGVEKSEKKAGSGRFLSQSRFFLVWIGIIRIVFAIYNFWMVSSLVESIEQAAPDGEEAGIDLGFILAIFYGIDAGIGVLFILFGIFIFLMPMTMSISAFLLFLLLEIFYLLLNPFSIVSILDWIIRIVVGGALIQCINNAAFFKFARAKANEE